MEHETILQWSSCINIYIYIKMLANFSVELLHVLEKILPNFSKFEGLQVKVSN